MGQEDTVLAAIYAVINMIIPVGMGFLLCKADVLTPKTRSVLSAVNFYALVPTYSMIFITKAINQNSLIELLFIFFSGIPSILMGIIISYILVFFIGADVRYKFSYIFTLSFQNSVVMPQMLADSLCTPGGKYAANFACKQALVKPYASLAMIYLNLVNWVVILPVLQNEKRISNEIKKAYIVALNYYDSIKEFMEDKEFSHTKRLKFDMNQVNKKIMEKNGIEIPSLPSSPTQACPTGRSDQFTLKPMQDVIVTSSELGTQSNLFKKENPKTDDAIPGSLKQQSLSSMRDKLARRQSCKVVSAANMHEPERDESLPRDFNDIIYIMEFFGKRITNAEYEETMKHYKEFEEKVFNSPERTEEKRAIDDLVLKPENLLEAVEIEHVFTWAFIKKRILLSPPAVSSFLAIIIGFIFPLKEWIFDPTHKPLPTFLSTLETIGGMMSPVAMFLLGTYVAQSAIISGEMFIRWKHVITANIVRCIILPLIGLLWVFVLIKNMDYEVFTGNPILIFIDYTYWIVPNGILLIAVYVVADYFAKEFAVISIYLNLISIPMMAVYLIVYFTIYDQS